MTRQVNQQVLFLGTSKLSAAFTAATTDIITSNAHGLKIGDKVFVASSTTLPAGLSAATSYYVIEPTTNTFKLSAGENGASVDITDTGTGTHTFLLKSKIGYISGDRHQNISVYTSGTANMTLKVKISQQDDVDFEAARSTTNRWEYVQVVDKEDDSTLDGDVGLVMAAADTQRELAVNADINSLINIEVVSWVAGLADVRLTQAND